MELAAVAIALVSSLQVTVQAAPITFHYAGQLVARSGNFPCGPSLLGRQARIAVTLNGNASDTTPEPEFGDYPGAITGFGTSLDGRLFFASSGDLRIELPPASDPGFYAFRVPPVGTSPSTQVFGLPLPDDCHVSGMDLNFFGPIARSFLPNDKIPLVPPDPAGFNEAGFDLTLCGKSDCSGGFDSYGFSLALVVEPSLVALLLTVAALLGISARLRR
jgi:hypothetical protein